MQTQWHYQDEKSGKRLGPVDRDKLNSLVAEGRLDRATLVWNPAMAEWARSSTTDLVDLFGNQPPPLPASEVSRWAIYVVALLPLWGVGVEAAISYYLSDQVQMTPTEMLGHRGWIAFYIVANGILGELDERNLEKAGLKIKGAAVLSALLIPVYIFMSCRTVARHATAQSWLAYIPFVLWWIALASSLVAGGYVEERLA